MILDDLAHPVPLAGVPQRIVSLVPSLTEAIACSAPGRLVGATDWCVHPGDLDLVRVRGTKNPDLEAIRGLRPDLVIANEEENRQADVETLRAQGISVWVTDVRSVAGALDSLTRLLQALSAPELGWLEQARTAWRIPTSGAAAYPPATARAVVAIWRRPWMFLGSDTYAGDLLRHLGVGNALEQSVHRYPRVDLAALPAHDLVLLPDEPYRFTELDGPEAFPDQPVVLLDGQALTWYGPRMVAARDTLTRQLAGVLAGPVAGQ